MTALWIIVAFVCGAAFWHQFGMTMVKKTFGKDFYVKNVIPNLSTDSLPTLRQAIDEEIERRRIVLADSPDPENGESI